MAKLPFVVAPRLQPEVIEIGDESTCGTIEIERKGYVTVGEKAFLSAQLAEDNSTNLILSLSKKAATHFKVDVQKAYEAIAESFDTSSSNSLANKIQEKYQEEYIALLNSIIAAEQRKKLMQAYCMILYRINPDFSANEFFELDPGLIEALSNHYRSEEMRTDEVIESKKEDSSKKAGFEDYEKK
jgi:hypothetical protein